MVTGRFLTIVVLLALGVLTLFTLQGVIATLGLTENRALGAPEKQAAVPSAENALEKAGALDERYRALYPQAFTDAALTARWRALEQGYQARYPQAYAESITGYWQALEERYRALYPEAFREAALRERWRALEERYRALYGVPASKP